MRLLRVTLRVIVILFILLNIMTAFHAYQFTRFHDDPMGVIKKPEQMSTWEKTKVILTGFHYPKSVNTLQPNLPFDTVSFITADQMKLAAWYIPQDSARGTVILFHGHASCKSKILDEAYYMHFLGFNTLLVDFRAHGDSEGHVCTIGYREANDVKAAFDYIKAKGEKHIVLWGVSLGAATIARAMADYGVKPEKAIMELSFGSAYGGVKGRARAMGIPEQPASAMLAFWGSVIRGFWVFGLNPEEYAKKITCPVLVQHAAKDGRVTLAESTAIFNNIPNANKKLVVYETAKHESLCNREPEKWKQEIKEFLLSP